MSRKGMMCMLLYMSPCHNFLSLLFLFVVFLFVWLQVWIRVKYHVKDNKTIMDKKRLIAFWLERYSRRENGKPVTVMFDLTETGFNNIVSTFHSLLSLPEHGFHAYPASSPPLLLPEPTHQLIIGVYSVCFICFFFFLLLCALH